MPASLLSAKLAAASLAAAVTLGGAAAAAYAGKLPAPVQKFAHDTIGAPRTPGAQPAPPATPQPAVLPGHSAYGLCTAYAHHKPHGSAARKTTAFRQLAAAAGGAAHIRAYCATVAHPGNPSPGAKSGHTTGKPSTHPSHANPPTQQASTPRPRTPTPPTRRANPPAPDHRPPRKAAAGACLPRAAALATPWPASDQGDSRDRAPRRAGGPDPDPGSPPPAHRPRSRRQPMTA